MRPPCERGCRNSEIADFPPTVPGRTRSVSQCGEGGGIAHRRLHAGGSAVRGEAGERSEPIDFVNLRETAGWSTEGAQAGPKMAALLAAAAERRA